MMTSYDRRRRTTFLNVLGVCILIGDAILASYAYRNSSTLSGIELIQWMMVAIFGILGATTLITASIISDNPSRTNT